MKLNELELRKWLVRKEYKKTVKKEELRAIRRAQIIEELGFDVTHATIERELKITRESQRDNR